SMKRLIIFALIVFSLSGRAAYAQDEEQARNLFLTHAADSSKGRPGAKINIELLRNNKRQMVPLNTVFRAGDKIKLHFEVNFPAYVEIYNRGTSGERERLFPYPGAGERMKIRSNYVVPYQTTQWFEFDNTPGTERLTFIFSSARLGAREANSTRNRPKDSN